MNESRIISISHLFVMLAIASVLFLVGFSNVNQQYNLTQKLTPALVQIKELFINRNTTQIPKRETNLGYKDMVSHVQLQPGLPLDVPLVNQLDKPQLINGCEVASLAMMLQYRGFNVGKNELAEQITTVPVFDKNGLRGNPNQGFVGDMAGNGFSVWHKPIFELAQRYVGDKVIDITGSSLSTLYDYIDIGIPVWIITTTTFAPVDDFRTWNTPQGQIKISYKSHSAVVTGYTDDFVYLNDPFGTKNKKVDRTQFEAAWVQMGSQAIVITE